MAYTRKQIVTCASIVYLIFTTALAGYASSRASRFSIPMSEVLSGFATALPIVAGLLLESGYDLNRRRERRRGLQKGETARPPLVIVANTLIFIYSTVVITLLGTHIAPASGLRCSLDERWRQLFQNKNSEAIRTIQDAFSCCGFVSSHDKAWPIPDKNNNVHSCEKTYGRTTACFGPWRREEQKVAGILMTVVVLVSVWQFAIIATPTRRESWLHRVLPDQVSRLIVDEENGRANDPRRAIDYLPNFQHYRDNVAEEIEEEEDVDTAHRAIEEGVRTNSNLLPDSNQEHGQPQPTLENEWARNN